MKFLFKYMSEPFDFSKSNAVTLVIENKKLFRHTILSVSECDCNEMFVFFENFKPLDFSKSVKYVDSVLTFEFSDRKMMTKVNSFFENLCNTKYFPQISEIKALCVSLCCELSKENDYDFQFCESIETMALVKLFSFAPADASDDNVGHLLRYFKLMKEYLGIKCFIVQNLHIYLDDSECENLLESAVMHGIYLLNIENSVPKEVSEYEKLVVIDNDLCEFY